jgi:hypothetical protein
MKIVVLAALAFAIACVVAGVIILSRPATPDTPLSAATATREVGPAPTADAARPALLPEASAPATASAVAPAPVSPVPSSAPSPKPARPAGKPPKAVAHANQGGSRAKQTVGDPLAREALAFVGADPEAETCWHAAINNPDLSAHERRELIEDLNRDGLPDPRHPTIEDLPLILNRLDLIQQLSPEAMDQVNARAFDEAYKDLVNIATKLMSQH